MVGQGKAGDREVRLTETRLDLEEGFRELSQEFHALGDPRFDGALSDFERYVHRVPGQGVVRRVINTLRAVRQRLRELMEGRARVDGLIACGTAFPVGAQWPEPRYVKRSLFWLLRQDGKLIGVGEIRHRLTPFLRYEGGHIGYLIRPSQRRNGYGTLMLKLLIERAQEIGLERVLVTCDADNEASRRIIKRNGGWLENCVLSRRGNRKLRYWICCDGARACASRLERSHDTHTS